MNVLRTIPIEVLPYSVFSRQAPYCSATAWSASTKSVKGREYVSRNFA